MAVELPLGEEGGDEQVVELPSLFGIAMELVAAGMIRPSHTGVLLLIYVTAKNRDDHWPRSLWMLDLGALVAQECQPIPKLVSAFHLKSLLPPSLIDPLPGSPSPVLTPCNPVPPLSPSRLCLLNASRKWSGSKGPRSRCFGFWVA